MYNIKSKKSKNIYLLFLTLTPIINTAILFLLSSYIKYTKKSFTYSIFLMHILPMLLIILNTVIYSFLLIKSKDFNDLNSFKIITLLFAIIFLLMIITYIVPMIFKLNDGIFNFFYNLMLRFMSIKNFIPLSTFNFTIYFILFFSNRIFKNRH